MAQETNILASVTKTGTYTSDTGVDVSAAVGDFTFKLQISAFSGASPVALIQLQYVAAADFTTPVVAKCFHLGGVIMAAAAGSSNLATSWTLTGTADLCYSIKSYDLAALCNTAWGQTNGKLRISIPVLGGTSPSITLRAWYEQ